MLACEARLGLMWLHEPMLKMVVSAPQCSNDCVFGSSFQNTPLEAVLYFVLRSGRPHVGECRPFLSRQKLGPHVGVR